MEEQDEMAKTRETSAHAGRNIGRLRRDLCARQRVRTQVRIELIPTSEIVTSSWSTLLDYPTRKNK